MKTQELKLYELLKVKIGEEETQLLLETIETKSEATIAGKVGVLATKEDVYQVREEMSHVREDMGHNKAELIKWMFIFWMGQLGTTIAIFKFLI